MLLLESGELSWFQYIQETGFSWHDRPISILSFTANFTIAGSDIWYLKAVNLFIHLSCGVLIYSICILLLSLPITEVSPKACKWIAVWVVSAWLIAPIQVSTTLYVIQRMAQLSTVFILAGLLCYIVGRGQIETKPRQGYALIIFTFILFMPLAIFSKENGAILPLLIFVIELFFFHKKKNPSRTDNIIFKSLLVILALPLCLILVAMVYKPDIFFDAYIYRDFTLYERALTQTRILIDYLMNVLMIPGGSGMSLFHDDYQKSYGLFSPLSTIISIIFWLILVVTALCKAGTKTGFVLFGLIFYIASHAIESSILPLELYFEHRNYLPSFGIFFAVALAVYYLISGSKIKNFVIGAMVLIIVGYSFFTIYRVDIWRSWASILLASQVQHPDSLRVQRGLSIVHIHRGEIRKALEHLSQVERLDDGRGETGIAIKYLMAYCYADEFPPEAIYQRLDNKETIPRDHYTGTVFMWFVESIEDKYCKAVDVERMLRIFQNRMSFENLNYNNWVQLILLARLYATQSDWIQARYFANKAIELRPNARKNYVENLKRHYDSM
jgi:protein O-mannosyl-transferase